MGWTFGLFCPLMVMDLHGFSHRLVSSFICIQWHVFAEVMDLQPYRLESHAIHRAARPCDLSLISKALYACIFQRLFRDFFSEMCISEIVKVFQFHFQDFLLGKTICAKLAVCEYYLDIRECNMCSLLSNRLFWC